MANKTDANLVTGINTNINDNTTGDITPADLRAELVNISDSKINNDKISIDITVDAASDVKISSPKSIKTFVDNKVGPISGIITSNKVPFTALNISLGTITVSTPTTLSPENVGALNNATTTAVFKGTGSSNTLSFTNILNVNSVIFDPTVDMLNFIVFNWIEGRAFYSIVAQILDVGAIPTLTAPVLAVPTATDSSVSLSWTQVTNNYGYLVQRSSDNITFADLISLTANINTYTNTGLPNNTTYYYKVKALGNSINFNDSVYSNTRTIATSASATLSTGLVASWNMDEATGNRLDSTANALHLITGGTVPSVTGKIGNAANFLNNSNNVLQVTSTLIDFDSPFTVCGWINLNNQTTQVLLGRFGSIQSQKVLQFVVNSTRIEVNINDIQPVVNQFYIVSQPVPAIGTWVFISLKWDGATVSFKLNDGTASTYSLNGITDNSSVPLVFGANSDPGANGVAGNFKADMFRIYSRALSSSEETLLFNSGNGLAS